VRDPPLLPATPPPEAAPPLLAVPPLAAAPPASCPPGLLPPDEDASSPPALDFDFVLPQALRDSAATHTSQ
jgi:hypothetical protein